MTTSPTTPSQGDDIIDAALGVCATYGTLLLGTPDQMPYIEGFKHSKTYREAKAAIQTQVDAAYQRGRTDEAKTCEQAKRHDTKGLYTQAQIDEAVRKALIKEHKMLAECTDGINPHGRAAPQLAAALMCVNDFQKKRADELLAQLTTQSKPTKGSNQ